MASVRKREWKSPDGTPKTAWIVTYSDPSTGKRIQGGTFERKKDADRERLRIENEVIGGIHTPVKESVLVREAADAFLRDCDRRWRAGDLAGLTIRSYTQQVARVAKRFGQKKVSELTAAEIQGFVDDCSETLAAHTVRSAYQSISMILRFSVKKKWVRRNLLKDEQISLPKTSKRAKVPSGSDIAALFASVREFKAPSDGDVRQDLKTFLARQLIVNLGVLGTFRPGEIFGLQWEDVDFDERVIRVRHSMSRVDGLKGPKTVAGNRNVPMTPPIRAALMRMAEYQTIKDRETARAQTGAITVKSMNNIVLTRWRGESVEINPGALKGPVIRAVLKEGQSGQPNNQVWRGLMQLAGLWDYEAKCAKFTMHALRHASVSLYISENLPLTNLKQLVGHKSIQTTIDVYGHLLPEDARTANAATVIAERLNATSQRHEPANT